MQFSVEHLGLAARNPAALKDWYVQFLGAKVVFETQAVPPAYFLKFPGGVIIEIYQADASMSEVSNNKLSGWRHLAVRVHRIEEVRDRLVSQGVVFETEIKPAGGGGRILFFRDPDGNLLHLVERPATSVFA